MAPLPSVVESYVNELRTMHHEPRRNMNVELKNVKIHPDMSEETNCFSATIYFDGKKIGEVRNNGRGGCNDYHWSDPVAGKALTAWAETQPHEFAFDHLDQVIDPLLEQQETIKWLKRNTKSKTLFRLPGDRKAEWRIVKAPFDAKVRVFILNKYPTVECIANEDLNKAAAFC